MTNTPSDGAVTRRTALKLAGSGAVAAAAVGVGAPSNAGAAPGGPTALASAPESTGAPAPTHEVGRFLLWLATDPDSAPRLSVAHVDEPGRALWESAPGFGFLAGGLAETVIEGNTTAASGFTITDKDLIRFDRQTVDSADIQSGMLVLRGSLSGADRTVGYTMTFSAAGDRQLRFSVEVPESDRALCNRVFLRYGSTPDERFYGFGQQMTYFDQKGRVLPILVQEHGVGRGLPFVTQLVDLAYGPRTAGNPSTTEVSVPQYVTSRRRSLFLENTEYCVFDLRYPDRVEIEMFASHLTGRILHGRTPLDLIETYTEYAGRMRELPDWVHEGAMICVQGGSGNAHWAIDTFASNDVAVSAFWLQDWSGTNRSVLGDQVQWNWQLSTEKYPDWSDIRSELADRLGARVVVYVNPFLTDAAGFNNLYTVAAERGYFVKNTSGDIYGILNGGFYAGLLDLTNPGARAWIKQIIIDNLIAASAAGASGWMADFGEALPFDSVLHSGEDPAVWHNRYAEEWARVNREAIQAGDHGDDITFFSRSGYTKSPGISTLFWVGDQLQTWDEFDGLKSAINGSLSGGVSGFSLVHADIGGFDSIALPHTNPPIPVIYRDAELLQRWSEFAAFTPVMRTHQGIAPALAWQVDRDWNTLAGFRRCVNMYLAWAPYRRQLVAEAAATGHPVMRHLALHYPDDPVTAGLRWQYLLGDALLVAPVTDPGAGTAEVYLPAGNWTHVWTRQNFAAAAGSWQRVPAPLGQPPLFLRDDSPASPALQQAFDAVT